MRDACALRPFCIILDVTKCSKGSSAGGMSDVGIVGFGVEADCEADCASTSSSACLKMAVVFEPAVDKALKDGGRDLEMRRILASMEKESDVVTGNVTERPALN